MAAKSIEKGISDGKDCVLCEKPCETGSGVLIVNVKVNFLIKYRAEVHPWCARDLRNLIDKMLKEME